MVSLRWIPKAEFEILFFSRAGLSYLGSSGLCLSGGSREPHALEEHRPVASPQNFVLCEHTPLGEKELRDGTKQAHLPLLHIMSFWQNPVRKLVCPPCWGHSWSLGNSSFSTTTQLASRQSKPQMPSSVNYVRLTSRNRVMSEEHQEYYL